MVTPRVPLVRSGACNANALQWEANCSQWPLLHELRLSFLSFGLGMVNPTPRSSRRWPDACCPRRRVLFLDDNTMNVLGAEQAGFLALRTQGVDEAHRALIEFGVLSP